ncbi:hypothetical protein J1614_001921 [Plenodomus biglobosus]|nr:hypothetical protein J1614_001921 [Plenodomus biglobosus]
MRSRNSLLTMVLATLSATIMVAADDGHDNTTSAYKLTDDLSYKNFFSTFEFFSGPDPTDGFVQYQTREAAASQNLVGLLEDTQSIFMGVDYKTKDPKGRASVRLESTKTWNQGLLIADIRHMPDSICGTWPAFWLLSGKNKDGDELRWPYGGEIDILEGVNDQTTNSVTLHTSSGCIVDNSSTTLAPGYGSTPGSNSVPLSFTGTMATSNCDVAAPNQDKNAGCSIRALPSLPPTSDNHNDNHTASPVPLPSYGSHFNAAGGGIYAMEWTSISISIWFIPRNSSLYAANFGFAAPLHAKNTTSNATSNAPRAPPPPPNPSTWGPPLARFAGPNCPFTDRFKDLKVIFDTTFCGQWAGREWERGGCAAKTGVETCEAYVRDFPEVFEKAYWEVAGLRWYERGGVVGEGGGVGVGVKSDRRVMKGRWVG